MLPAVLLVAATVTFFGYRSAYHPLAPGGSIELNRTLPSQEYGPRGEVLNTGGGQLYIAFSVRNGGRFAVTLDAIAVPSDCCEPAVSTGLPTLTSPMGSPMHPVRGYRLAPGDVVFVRIPIRLTNCSGRRSGYTTASFALSAIYRFWGETQSQFVRTCLSG